MNEEGVLKSTILIGSWCLFFYKNIFENFEPLIRTTDIDFYVPQAKAIKEKNGLINSLKEINYDVVQDTLSHKSTFISADGFELEFLTRLNRNHLSCVKLGNTTIYAESLSYVEIFTGNYIEIEYSGIQVKVASPSSYIIQKLLINDKRKEKAEKDIQSVKYVFSYVLLSRKYSKEFVELFDSLPKKWKKIINNTASRYNINLELSK